MSSINQLTQVDTLSAGDLFPVWNTNNGNTRQVSANTVAAFVQSQIDANGGLVTQYAAPNATGFTVTIAPPVAGTSVYLLLTPTGGFAAGTIVLPGRGSAVDGQELLVNCTQAVTTLTLSASGSSIVGGPTTLAANAFFRLRYDGVFNNWYRVG